MVPYTYKQSTHILDEYVKTEFNSKINTVHFILLYNMWPFKFIAF